MGSLNFDGTPKLQLANNLSIRHQGDFLTRASSDDDTLVTDAESISNSGVVRSIGDGLVGVVWQPGGTDKTQGLSAAERGADNSVERQKFTANGQEAGNLQQNVTRKISGIHTSVSNRQAIVNPVSAQASGLAGGDALGAMQSITERKVFFIPADRGIDGQPPSFSDWQIYDSAGNAVGADDGVSDVDITPNRR
jgi:hypothetical protein